MKLFLIILLILLTTFVIKIVKSKINNKKEQELIEKNYSNLKKLETRNIDTVEKKISKSQEPVEPVEPVEKEDSSKIEEPNNKEVPSKSDKNKDVSNKTYFEDSVFMGDSITEALDFYSLLNPSSVLAKKGQNIVQAKNSIPQLANLNPKRIFLLYGLNDLERFKSIDEYQRNYTIFVKKIKEVLPNSEIYILSITHVQAKTESKRPMLSDERVESFSNTLKNIALSENAKFIDITSVYRNKDYLYEPDGIHFNVKFYNTLLDYLKGIL
ncbi:GDSL-type esterase/lipase family protein [Haloimpatiens sp. FM7315]|uniref:GDSL-type esterase/lipase family protein n=1 Tax=Haloimpatiens sp. FM7315 TaxID=3298609 RepID=UPI0035A26890